MTLANVGSLSCPCGCSWVLKASQRGSSSVCLEQPHKGCFCVYLPPFPAFGRGKRGVICQSAEAHAAAGADLRQCHQLHGPVKSSTAQCGGDEQRTRPNGLLLLLAAPARLAQRTRGCSAQEGASFLGELLLSEAWVFLRSNIREDVEAQGGLKIKSSLCKCNLESSSVQQWCWE